MSACSTGSAKRANVINIELSQAQQDSIVFRDTLIADLNKLDFARYSDPASCERAVYHIELLVIGEGLKRVNFRTGSNTLSPIAREVGERCINRLSVDSTAPNQLFFMQRLGLILGHDQLAEEAVTRRIRLTESTTAQAHVLLESMLNYLQITPARVEKAEQLAALLSQLGDTVRVVKLQADHALLAHYSTVFNVSKIYEYSQRVMDISKTLTSAEKNLWARVIYAPYLYTASAMSYLYGADSAISYLKTHMDSLGTLGNQWDKSSLLNSYARLERIADIVGEPAPTLEGIVKVGADPESVRPVVGKISIFTTFDKNCGPFCTGRYEIVRSVDSAYGNNEISLTFVAKTIGFSFPPGVQTTKEEMDSISQIFLTTDLPGTLFIQESSFFEKPDGRRVAMPSSFEESYLSSQTVVVDKAGVIRWMGLVEPSNESAFRSLIRRLLGH